jgi:hypothetical protein
LRKLENSRVGLKQLSAKARIDPFATPSGNGRYLRKRDAHIRPEST